LFFYMFRLLLLFRLIRRSSVESKNRTIHELHEVKSDVVIIHIFI
jgi:hypothetical protein